VWWAYGKRRIGMICHAENVQTLWSAAKREVMRMPSFVRSLSPTGSHSSTGDDMRLGRVDENGNARLAGGKGDNVTSKREAQRQEGRGNGTVRRGESTYWSVFRGRWLVCVPSRRGQPWQA
jgi:hypothetical protein